MPIEPWVGELMLVPYNFVPKGWLPCEGQILPIASNSALFSLLGVTFGGDGRTTFGLPDLRGRVPMGDGQGPGLSPRTRGEVGGEPTHTLVQNEMPEHTHRFQCETQGASQTSPVGGVPSVPNGLLYAPMGAGGMAAPLMLAFDGAPGPHENMQPYIALQWVIATQGTYPQRQ
jgi:microcystin-dependent protein